MNKTEATHVNTLLRWLLAGALPDDPGVDVEIARWVAANLAERAHREMRSGLTKARVETAWDTLSAVPGGLNPLAVSNPDPWEETAAGLAAVQCCSSHRPQDGAPLKPAPHLGPGRMLARCCDPEDCGPCCPDCPTCPTQVATRAGR
ncbi:MAG TPA: hypothetical protein VFY38_14640 [Pseudonocardia sp.]|nr:hypothetical protein [Pseudonocardia sp.]